MTVPERPDESWRKASYSSSNQDCVELNGTLTAVRDSKNGDLLRLNVGAVGGLLAEVKRDH
jgi:hypothetical protein